MIDFSKGFIEITGANIRDAIKSAYRNSRPQGLGMLHFVPGDLDEETVELIASRPRDLVHGVSMVHMDYVHGRAVKMTIYTKDDKMYIAERWYDHNDTQLQTFLAEIKAK